MNRAGCVPIKVYLKKNSGAGFGPQAEMLTMLKESGACSLILTFTFLILHGPKYNKNTSN